MAWICIAREGANLISGRHNQLHKHSHDSHGQLVCLSFLHPQNASKFMQPTPVYAMTVLKESPPIEMVTVTLPDGLAARYTAGMTNEYVHMPLLANCPSGRRHTWSNGMAVPPQTQLLLAGDSIIVESDAELKSASQPPVPGRGWSAPKKEDGQNFSPQKGAILAQSKKVWTPWGKNLDFFRCICLFIIHLKIIYSFIYYLDLYFLNILKCQNLKIWPSLPPQSSSRSTGAPIAAASGEEGALLFGPDLCDFCWFPLGIPSKWGCTWSGSQPGNLPARFTLYLDPLFAAVCVSCQNLRP